MAKRIFINPYVFYFVSRCKNMDNNDMVEMTRIYIDAKGAGRLYIPKEFMGQLGFHNKEKMFLSFDDGFLTVSAARKDVLKR
jgi:hypothetical protein